MIAPAVNNLRKFLTTELTWTSNEQEANSKQSWGNTFTIRSTANMKIFYRILTIGTLLYITQQIEEGNAL